MLSLPRYHYFELTINHNRYLICLTIGPAFLAAAIYLCLGRIVVVYGESISRIQPRIYSIIFISCDFLSLVLQAAGGALAATADTKADGDVGVNIMVRIFSSLRGGTIHADILDQMAGLSTQVVSLILFMILSAEFAWRVRLNPDRLNPRFAGLRSSKMWNYFLIGTFKPREYEASQADRVERSYCGYGNHLHPLRLSSCRAQ